MHRTCSTHLTGCSARIRQVPQLGPCGRRHASGALLPWRMQRTPAPPLPPAAPPPRRSASLCPGPPPRQAYECCGGLWGAACAVPHTDAPARDAAWCGGARPRPHGQVRSALATATRRRLCARTAQRIHCGPCGLVSADLWLAHPIGSSGASACRAAPDTVCRMFTSRGFALCAASPHGVRCIPTCCSRTNAFLKNTRDEKALTYNDISIQESYHVSQVERVRRLLLNRPPARERFALRCLDRRRLC